MGFISKLKGLFGNNLQAKEEPTSTSDETLVIETHDCGAAQPEFTFEEWLTPINCALDLNANTIRFVAAIQSDIGSFINEDTDTAIHFSDSEIGNDIDSNSLELATSFFLIEANVLVEQISEIADKNQSIYNLVKYWTEQRLREQCAKRNISLENVLLENILNRRECDRDAAISVMQQRWLYLKPLLTRSLHDGVDKYGEQNYEPFYAVCKDFVERFLPDSNLSYYKHGSILNYVLKAALTFVESDNAAKNTIPVIGVEFEHWCAEKISSLGWTTRVTQTSNDQGLDIIAIKGDISVAIQCKRYAGSVGNAAVQEVFTGKTHFSCSHACVISTGLYTRSAKSLAKTTGVVLIDANDIELFNSYFTNSSIS